MLLVSRNVTSGQVSNERDIRNIGEVRRRWLAGRRPRGGTPSRLWCWSGRT